MVNQDERLFDCQMMFRHACAFAECADLAKAKFKHDTADIDWYTTPAIVNSAFACEVFLKAILLFHCITDRKKHAIKDLYDLLPDREREWIKETVKQNFGGIWTHLGSIELITTISDAFVEWRYMYEKDWRKGCSMQINIGFLNVFRDTLREACCQLFFKTTWDKYERGIYG